MHSDFLYRRTCKANEKKWRKYCVDINIEDVWLDRLFSLIHFELILICEGHHKRRGLEAQSPCIEIRIKNHHQAKIKNGDFEQFLSALEGIFHSCIPTSDFYSVLALDYVFPNDSLGERLSEIKLKVFPIVNTPFIDSTSRNMWFEKAIDMITIIDEEWNSKLDKFIVSCKFNDFLA